MIEFDLRKPIFHGLAVEHTPAFLSKACDWIDVVARNGVKLLGGEFYPENVAKRYGRLKSEQLLFLRNFHNTPN